MARISEPEIRNALKFYGIPADARMISAVSTYVDLLLKWNSKISLTTVTDPLEIVRYHFGECMYGGRVLRIENGRLADVGAGAGFPGLPLKMLSQKIDLYLIEPNMKKAAFLSELVRELKFDGVEILRFRMQDLPVTYADFDFITTRALGGYEVLLRWAANRLIRRGRAVLWVGESDATGIAADAIWTWNEPLRIPGSQRRVVLTGFPNRL